MRLFRDFLLTGLLICLQCTAGYAFQIDFGAPFIRNIAPEEYKAKIQNWHAAQSSSGIIYIANLGGVVEYDGEQWRTIDLPNITALSVGVYNDTVFVGGVNEIGYLYSPPDDSAHIRYRSLTNQVPDSYSDFGDVWQAISTDDSIYFRTGKYLFRYQNGTFKHWQSETGFHFAFSVRNELYINIRQKGLHKMTADGLKLVKEGENFAEDGIYAMLPYRDGQILMATRFKNLIIYDGNKIKHLKSEANNFIEQNRLYNGLKLTDGSFVFGTTQGGIIRIDQQGNVLDIINKENGLLDDVVYHLFEDREGNLWVSQNEGLSVINVLSPIRIFDERHGLEGMPISMFAEEEQFYVGTTQGLFQWEENSGVFLELADKIPQDFEHISGGLLFVATDGVWQIKEGSIEKKSDLLYGNCISRSSIHSDILYVCTRGGLSLAQKDGQELINLGKIEGIEAEVTSIAEDSEGNAWVGAPTKGIYQLRWEATEESILEPQIRLRATDRERSKVFEIDDEVFLGFKNITLKYNSDKDALTEEINIDSELLPDDNPGIFLMARDNDNNYWFRSSQHNFIAKRQSQYSFKAQLGFLNLIKSNQYNFIYPDERNHVWFGTDEGLLRYEFLAENKKPADYQSLVREVLIHNDSLIYRGPRINNKNHTLRYSENELRFRYAAPSFVRSDDVEYQVYLEGFDEKWSNWTSETRKDYTNIPEGIYSFKVRARNINDKISKAGTFNFKVLSPWYRTWWAYTFYALLFGGLIYGGHKFRINRILREQRIRNRIASDLHDEVSATLSSITYFAQAIRQMQNGKQTERFIALISESAFEAKEKITDIIWSIDPDNDDWVNLLSKCRRFASDLFESKKMEYELNIDTDIAHPLDVEMRQHLWLIFKEMVVNAARHSRAKRVDIFFGLQNGALKLVVQDNGIGIEDNVQTSGNGIKNINKRAQELRADLELETDRDIGTRWIMSIEM